MKQMRTSRPSYLSQGGNIVDANGLAEELRLSQLLLGKDHVSCFGKAKRLAGAYTKLGMYEDAIMVELGIYTRRHSLVVFQMHHSLK